MPRWADMVLRRLSAAVSIIALFAAGCTRAPATVEVTPAPAQLTGSIRSFVATPTASSIATFDLSDGEVATVKAGIPVEAVNLGAVATWTTADGAWIVAAAKHDVQLYRAAAGQSPLPLEPKLGFPGTSAPEVAIGPKGAVVATCRGVFTRSFEKTAGWDRAGRGCWAAVSDDGRSFAYAPDGRHLVIRPFDGSNGGPAITVDLERELEPLI